jgi:hypothetical protein
MAKISLKLIELLNYTADETTIHKKLQFINASLIFEPI